MKKRAFTLTELIVVIAIIVILSGLVFSVAGTARKQGMINATKQEIQLLEQALRQYYEDMYEYPGNGNAQLVLAFNPAQVGEPEPTITTWHGPYFDFDDDRIVGGEFLDLWGTAYGYYRENDPIPPPIWTLNNANFIDLYSYGSDKLNNSGNGKDSVPDTGDDIVNW